MSSSNSTKTACGFTSLHGARGQEWLRGLPPRIQPGTRAWPSLLVTATHAHVQDCSLWTLSPQAHGHTCPAHLHLDSCHSFSPQFPAQAVFSEQSVFYNGM